MSAFNFINSVSILEPSTLSKLGFASRAFAVGAAALALNNGCVVVDDTPTGGPVYEEDHYTHTEEPVPERWQSVICNAVAANASSTSSVSDYGHFAPEQATGLPDAQDWEYPVCQDSTFAWAPASRDAGLEFLDLLFEVPMLVDRVRIYENDGAGAMLLVSLSNSLNSHIPIIETEVSPSLQGPGQPCSVLNIDVDAVDGYEWTDDEYDSVMLDLDTAMVAGWNEIDAVEVIGLLDTASFALPPSCRYY